MRLFLPAIPHTVTSRRFSHCAFTQKVLNAAVMWSRIPGLHVVHLGVEGSELPHDVDRVDLLSTSEHLELLGIRSYDEDDPSAFVGNRANTGHPVYRQFNHYLREELKARLEHGDVVCLPFGHAHDAAIDGLAPIANGDVALIETGIGYPDPATNTRVYESNAWRHWVMGNEAREGSTWKTTRLEWVVPNYYNLDDWPIDHTRSELDASTVVFLGRIGEMKGLDIVPILARELPHLRFVLCGQGDPSPYCTAPNIEHRAPIHGRERAAFLSRSLCAISPSRYVEPFCGAAVEAMLCGTPAITSDFGAFTETVIDGVTGARCRDIASWIDAIDRALMFDRDVVARRTRERYSLEAVGHQYAIVFDELARALRTQRMVTA